MINEKTMVGSALIRLIREEQKKRNLTTNEIANLLGMSKPYLTAILSGERSVDRINASYLEAIAIFLNLPKAQIYNLAEILRPSDYVHQESIENSLAKVHQRLCSDVSLLHLAPTEAEWKNTSLKGQLLIAYMYEMVSHEKIIEGIKAYKFE